MSSPLLLARYADRKALPLAQRAEFARLGEELSDDLGALAQAHGEEVVVLNTCERFEVYYTSNSTAVAQYLAISSELLRGVTLDVGPHALRHLFRVASGLESRIRGEPHILGQVRLAFAQSQQRGNIGRTTADAFSYAIRCGRRVRTRSGLGQAGAGYASRTGDWLRLNVPDIAASEIGIVGSGALASEVARELLRVGVPQLTIIGRHQSRLEALTREIGHGTAWLSLDSFCAAPPRFAAVVTAVAAAQPLIHSAMVEQSGTRIWIDLGAAPNIDAPVALLPNIRLVRLEELGDNEETNSSMARAEMVLEHEVSRFLAMRIAAGERPGVRQARKAS